MRGPLLEGALRVLLPTPTQTLLLRACLCGDLSAWERWCAAVGDPKQVLGGDTLGIKRLVPLLYTSLRDGGKELDADFLSYLRAAYVREDRRAHTFRRVCHEALEQLTEAEIPYIVLKGVSLVESAYPTWPLRHCHDIDLLVDADIMQRSITALWDFTIYSADHGNITLVHPTHLPVSLHARLFDLYDNPVGIWAASQEARIADVSVRVPAPHHALLQICVHAASTPSRRGLLWTADALHLLRHVPDLDWDALVLATRQTALPMFVMLRYLREALDAPIPDAVLETLASRPGARAEALRGAIATARRRDVMVNARGWPERLVVGAWIIKQVPERILRRCRGSEPNPRPLP